MEISDRYKIVATFENVLFKVPAKKNLEKIDAHTFFPMQKTQEIIENCQISPAAGQEVLVGEHYRGKLIVTGVHGNKIIVNQKFFGLADHDLGRRICARIEIEEKTTPDFARKFTMMNIYKDEKSKPAVSWMISDRKQGVPILNTEYEIALCPLYNTPYRKRK